MKKASILSKHPNIILKTNSTKKTPQHSGQLFNRDVGTLKSTAELQEVFRTCKWFLKRFIPVLQKKFLMATARGKGHKLGSILQFFIPYVTTSAFLPYVYANENR